MEFPFTGPANALCGVDRQRGRREHSDWHRRPRSRSLAGQWIEHKPNILQTLRNASPDMTKLRGKNQRRPAVKVTLYECVCVCVHSEPVARSIIWVSVCGWNPGWGHPPRGQPNPVLCLLRSLAGVISSGHRNPNRNQPTDPLVHDQTSLLHPQINWKVYSSSIRELKWLKAQKS